MICGVAVTSPLATMPVMSAIAVKSVMAVTSDVLLTAFSDQLIITLAFITAAKAMRLPVGAVYVPVPKPETTIVLPIFDAEPEHVPVQLGPSALVWTMFCASDGVVTDIETGAAE